MATSDMMLEKWTIAFKLLDFKKDGVINKDDRDACKESFLKVYGVTGPEADKMCAELDAFWSKSVFLRETPDWTKTFTYEDILKTRQASYEKDPTGTVDIVREAMAHLIRAANVKTLNKFDFQEFERLHVAFNLNNPDLINGIFAMSSPVDGICSSDKIVEFYTELTMGSDTTKHEQYKAALKSVGFL